LLLTLITAAAFRDEERNWIGISLRWEILARHIARGLPDASSAAAARFFRRREKRKRGIKRAYQTFSCMTKNITGQTDNPCEDEQRKKSE
jgi:hypothetical protein